MSDLATKIDDHVLKLLEKAGTADNVKDYTAAVLAAVKWHDSKRGVPGAGMGGALGGDE